MQSELDRHLSKQSQPELDSWLTISLVSLLSIALLHFNIVFSELLRCRSGTFSCSWKEYTNQFLTSERNIVKEALQYYGANCWSMRWPVRVRLGPSMPTKEDNHMRRSALSVVR